MDHSGLLICARYAFAPNKLHYCGPERQSDLLGYLTGDVPDFAAAEILNKFETLFPYLRLIAAANEIRDPFDPSVVEAYWIGNPLLLRVKPQQFLTHIGDDLHMKHKLSLPQINRVNETVASGFPYHTFHVLNIFLRTGHLTAFQVLSTMDSCRISWGKVIRSIPDSDSACPRRYLVESQRLHVYEDSLTLGEPETVVSEAWFVNPDIDDFVTMHWGVICGTANQLAVRQLRKYTDFALRSANRNHTNHNIV